MDIAHFPAMSQILIHTKGASTTMVQLTFLPAPFADMWQQVTKQPGQCGGSGRTGVVHCSPPQDGTPVPPGSPGNALLGCTAQLPIPANETIHHHNYVQC